jgi:predicted nucleotidyltransferase
MEMIIAPEAMARYRRTAQARELAQRQAVEGRRQVAWSVARRAARLLRATFGATRVIAFGSLAHGTWFGPRSDIDLAVEGVPADAFWRAWAALDRADPAFEIDLVAIESAPDRLRDEIDRQGVALYV